ncbi:MAG: amino acid racemase [Candidatus Bathyarchaeota archaeon]|jgi:aspartate racemase|nr:amino acid racemase [Candidatus Bathyarchaeota archaeon A05DMB-3]MDH7607048.1 amino acid racemase [Candidatus Bathyarchaeota archaeon]
MESVISYKPFENSEVEEAKLKGKVIGILGGMGPEATAELFFRIIKETPAESDQDHPRIIVDNNPKIPDRTAAILGEGENPLPEMVKTAKNLERAGADFIVMPCVTAHYYYNDLRKGVKIPVLNMIELTAQTIREGFPNVKKVGFLGTTGTVKTKIFDNPLNRVGVKAVYPSDENQKRVMEAIYTYIKAGKILEGRKIVIEEANHLIDLGADAIICGCTEISLVLKDGDIAKPVIDPLQILARNAVMIALGRVPIPKV